METIEQRIANLETLGQNLSGELIAHHIALVKVLESSPAARAALAKVDPKQATGVLMFQPVSDLCLAMTERALQRLQRHAHSGLTPGDTGAATGEPGAPAA
jgi:hypothetical protein